MATVNAGDRKVEFGKLAPNTFKPPPNAFKPPPNTLKLPPSTFTLPPDTFKMPLSTVKPPSNTFMLPQNTFKPPPNTFMLPPNTNYFQPLQRSSYAGSTLHNLRTLLNRFDRLILGGHKKQVYRTEIEILKFTFKDVLVESRSWWDRNLKFGPNCDLEVDNLEKN